MNQKGYTLQELAVALIVMCIIVLGGFFIFTVIKAAIKWVW